MFRECVNRKEFLFSEISATLEVHFEIVPDELGLWRCSLYEVNSVCYSQFSLWFNNFFLILHTRQLPPENSHCWPPCMNNQQNTILTDETTDSAKSLINRPSNWPSHITSPSALWSRQGASCDPRFTKTMRCERQRSSRCTTITHLQAGVLWSLLGMLVSFKLSALSSCYHYLRSQKVLIPPFSCKFFLPKY